MGGPGPAAKELDVYAQTVHRWLEGSIGGVAFEIVVKLSKKGDVPLEYLARRLGLWNRPYVAPTRAA